MTFKAGESGNPQGRPKGSGSRQQLFNSLVEPHKDALCETAIKLALEGNEAMLRLLLERILPVKPVDDSITLELSDEDLKRPHALLAYGEEILKASVQGRLTPQQAKILMSSIETQRKIIEAVDINERVEAIERNLRHRK